MNRIDESDMEMSRCHNNLLEQNAIIEQLQLDNNNLRDQLRQAHEEIQTINKQKDEFNQKSQHEIDSEHDKIQNKHLNKELKKLKNAYDKLSNELENKNYIMAELKQSDIDNLDIIQNLSNELEK